MADLPVVSGRKRCISEADDSVLTPKKARVQVLSTPSKSKGSRSTLPSQLANIVNTHTQLEEALIPALATTNASAPVPDKNDSSKFNMPNVLPHVSIPTLSLDSFKRLVWILEWDGEEATISNKRAPNPQDDDSDNPFLVQSNNLVRGGVGIIVTQTTHLNRSTNRRSAVYGIGIQVDVVKGENAMSAMNIVTRWIEGAEQRKDIVQERVQRWAQIQRKASRETATRERSRASSPTPTALPPIPLASLPALAMPSPVKSPVKALRATIPQTPSKPRSTIPFPTPSSTTSTSSYTTAAESLPSTPRKSETPFATPKTARREALYERIRQKSITGTPTKGSVTIKLSEDKDGNARTKTIGADELKRRALLSKLDGVAECVSLLFATNTATSVMSPQKRRIMRRDEVVRVIVKSSKAPLSDAEANDSIGLLLDLCPNFLIIRTIDREHWLEMPTALSSLSSALQKSPTKRRPPPSPGAISQADLEDELLSRKPGEGSPKRIRVAPQYTPSGKQFMTLREVRERIREELERE